MERAGVGFPLIIYVVGRIACYIYQIGEHRTPL